MIHLHAHPSDHLATLEVHDRGTRGATIELRGDIDLDGASAIGDEFRWAIAQSEGPIVIECSHIGFVDSGGLRLLIEAQAMASCRGHRLVLVGLPTNFATVLRIAGLDDLMLGT